MSDIKSMKLYSHVERVYNELAELGITDRDRLRVDELSRFDQLHYHGTSALDMAIQIIGAVPGARWLEIGSGIGGPARYLAHSGNIHVTALELQPDQNRLAEELTERCGLSEQIEHLCGDFLNLDWEAQRCDAVVSWLALYHIPARRHLLDKCHALLKPGGYFYTEDLCALGEFDLQQRADLEHDLFAITLPSLDQYRCDLESGGFEIEHFQDMSADWAEYTQQRLSSYRADRERHMRVHGEATVAAMDDFYSSVDDHFQSGKLGGIRVCARRGEKQA